jgi:tryptophan-rich sensory protein
MRVWAISLACCLLAAWLEGVFAGPGVRRQLHEITMPSFAPPFWGWIAIGIGYYLMALTLLIRLLRLPPSSLKVVSLALLGGVLFLNALWNLFFFRRREFGQAFAVSLIYSVLSCGLFALLLVADRFTALIFLPYVLYLGYANTFGYWVWRLNGSTFGGGAQA